MATNVLGIENLKKGVKLVVDLYAQGAKSAEDGIQLSDGLSFITELMQVPGVLSAKGDIAAEAMDVTPEELTELENYAVAELGQATDKAKLIVQHSIGIILSGIGLFAALRTTATEVAS